MIRKKILPYAFVVLLAVVTLIVKRFNCNVDRGPVVTAEEGDREMRGFNRNPSYIKYSKHSRCRMQCRNIDEAEVKDILLYGAINYKKSELQGDDCHKKYAVEGYSKDNQHLRIVFAPCGNEVTVVTCIDIGQEWNCDCR